MLSANDIAAIVLTLEQALISTLILLLIGTPMAWWLANTTTRFKPAIEAIIALPLVLPPTVLGFYLLISFAPDSLLGQIWLASTGSNLAFSFSALVIGSVIYSLPFVVQPLQVSFEQIPKSLQEVAATLGASASDRFISIVIPTTKKTFITASCLGFAHTIGEFGVVLMIGGNIPGETQVLSIALFDRVESLQFAQAHILSVALLLFSFIILSVVYSLNKNKGKTILFRGDR